MSTERDVGIECYANSSAGFTGILRHRYTDFKVNEIDLDGTIVSLKSLEPPAPTLPAPSDANGATALPPPRSVAALVDAYGALSGLEATALAGLTQFLEQAVSLKQGASRQVPRPLMLAPLASKEQRREAHQLFKGHGWLPALRTEAVESAPGGALQCISVSVDGGHGGGRGGQKRPREARAEWGGGAARYVRFALYKENMDTHQAISALAQALHCGTKLFAVAGTKDKRAATVQRVTAFKVAPVRLAALNASLRGLRLGDFEYVGEQLRLGDLSGNRFDIVLRGIGAGSGSAVCAAAAGLRASGFVNYFGLQRFGSSHVATHRVGVALIQGRWEQAVRDIVAPAPGARPAVEQACRAYLERGDAKAALAAMPRHLVAECAILAVLAREGATSLVNALMAVPRNLRVMYLHAYQSYLWNVAASARIAQHGAASVIAGDLVIPLATMQRARKRRAAEFSGGGDGGGAACVAADDGVVGEVVGEEVHVVTEEEAAAGKYGIEDVVLPLPGQHVMYPANSTGEVYRAVAERDGVALDRTMHSVPEFSLARLPGAYRHVLHRPADLQYEVLRYDDPDADLALTQLEELQGRAPLVPAPEGRFMALRLQFSLPSSCYATMLIRELTKMPTHNAFAKALKHPE